MNYPLNILMVTAENDGIPRCKVGGIGDVIRDIPAALADQGCRTSVITPSYGFLHKLDGSTLLETFTFSFGGYPNEARLYRVRPRTESAQRSIHYVIDHPLFLHYNAEKGQYNLYNNDPPERPFATDATQFACFCAAVATAIKSNFFGPLDVLHLHDWHAAFLLLLRQYHPDHFGLRSIRTVYTIHNLALQGIRPLRNDPSSLESWYPELKFYDNVPELVRDPRWPNCVNPMAIGIRMANAVHTVSPTYAEEILQPSRPPQYFGGEGLEHELRWAKGEGRLHGILNGCEYPEKQPAKKEIKEILALIRKDAARWASQRSALSLADFTVFRTLDKLSAARSQPTFIATSISRVVDQKMLLLKTKGSDGMTGLEKILHILGPKGLYILLGTGDRDTESFLAEMAVTHHNFLFLNSYANQTADALYASGDLFLMPSSFEPCGIGQMIAMRNGQPCLVHRTGGLRDTVHPGVNGFGFEGATAHEQVDNMAETLKAAMQFRTSEPERWMSLCQAAADTRFLWKDYATEYREKLYHARTHS